MTDQEFEVAKRSALDLCDEINASTHFFDALSAYPYAPSLFFSHFNVKAMPNSVDFANGATRYVFWDPDDCTYVIKVQFADRESFNYGAQECAVYEEAKRRGIDKYFTFTRLAFTYKDIEVYIADFIDVDEDHNINLVYDYWFEKWCADLNYQPTDDNYEEWQNSDNYDPEYFETQDGILDYIYDKINCRDARAIIDLITDSDINDIHIGNFGWRDETIIFTDYAGYERKLAIVK